MIFLFTFVRMKIKYFTQTTVLIGFVALSSCGNDVKKMDAKKKDSSNVKISVEYGGKYF